MVLALANIFAVMMQPAVAAFADTTKKISMKNLSVILVGIAGMLAAARFFMSDIFWALAVLFILELTLLFTLQPLVNSLGMQLINNGIGINFGLARGTGSMAFAVLSILLGIVVDRFGTDSLPIVSVVLYIMLGTAVFTFTNPRSKNDIHPTAVEGHSEEPSSSNLLTFVANNKKFCVLMVAVALTFCSHTMINNYMIQITENVGGTSKEMGIATGIAAAIELPAMILFGFLLKKYRCSSILKYSLLFFMIKTLITLLAANVWVLYFAQLLQCSAYALFIPGSIYYVNRVIKKEDLAKGQAFMTSAITLGGVAASLVGGWLLDGPGVGGMLMVGLIASVLGLIIGFYSIERVDIIKDDTSPAVPT